jgi:hypothetical protein
VPALLVGVAALTLALLGLTFPGVVAGAGAALLAGRAWPRANRDVLVVALGCGAAALAIGFVTLVQIAYG